VDAVEGVFGDGRAPAVRRSVAGRRSDERGLSRVRHFAQDRLYKIFERYKEHGLEALTDRSRRPVRYANQLPRQIESPIVAAKRDKPHWGARKIPSRVPSVVPKLVARSFPSIWLREEPPCT
jgi:hypothetical protein